MKTIPNAGDPRRKPEKPRKGTVPCEYCGKYAAPVKGSESVPRAHNQPDSSTPCVPSHDAARARLMASERDRRRKLDTTERDD